jgi:hypothetical protein
MDPQQAFTELRRRLDKLLMLNPDLGVVELQELYGLADRAAADRFGEIEAFTNRLISLYLESPAKRVSEQILTEYFHELGRSARLLAESGAVDKELRQATAAQQSVALVPQELYTPLEWCRVLCASELPHDLMKAVEACRRRSELVSTVLEYALVVMQRLDLDQALRWQLAFLETNRGQLDPDLVRDLINAWLTRPTLPRAALAWAEAWSADQNLLRLWPHVVRRADRLLCQHALDAWIAPTPARGAMLARLHRLVREQETDDRSLLAWLKSALTDMGETILRFVSLSRQVDAPDAAPQPWRSGAIVREILRVESLFTPVLLTADRILDVPDGANTFAVAFFGLVGKGRQLWEAKLHRLAERAVRQAFLEDMRAGVGPLRTIERLTFGDQQACEWAMGELDAATLQFDSVRQREGVVRFLSVFLASYREQELLGGEVLRRYRSLMKLMHEDHLRRVLAPDHFEEVMRRSILRDLASVAAEARRYLSRRRALESSLPELVATEIEFTQGIRRRRLRLIHTLLG